MKCRVNKVFYDTPLDNGSTPVARVVDEVVEIKEAKARELAKKGIVTILNEGVTVAVEEEEKKTKAK